MPSAGREPARRDVEGLRDVVGKEPIERFERELRRLGWTGGDVGVAVSGGPDSTALLLLAISLLGPSGVRAATVDHGLRSGSRDEAKAVADFCHLLGVRHAILDVVIPKMRGGPHAAAREARYAALDEWHRTGWLLVGHHRDDVAESLIQRLSRGSGVRGLALMADRFRLAGDGAMVLRPLLRWTRDELADLCERVAAPIVMDPSNLDLRFDRARARRLLMDNPWLDPGRLFRTAGNLKEADAALVWLAERSWRDHVVTDANLRQFQFDPADLPHDTRRRIIAQILERFAGPDDDRDIETMIERLTAGQHAMLADVQAVPGAIWTFRRAPPRRPS